jgi:5-amino-6-(5-phosphoribosylamino)uracil reductase
MYVTAVVAVTIDGFIGHNLSGRLNLSSNEDLDQVMELRANCDAILIGAETIRKDNSALITRSEKFIQDRQSQNKCKDPMKVTLTRTGNISLESNFLKMGSCRKIVYATSSIKKEKEVELNKIVALKKFDTQNLTATQVINDLTSEGVESLIVEGGTQILSMFFSENVVDELRLSVVPFFVGDENAPRLVNSGRFIFDRNNRMLLRKVEKLGDTAVMFYDLKKQSQ